MTIDYKDKKVVIVGAGSTGRSLARFFVARGANVILSDSRQADRFHDLGELEGIGVRLDLGGHAQELFISADLIAVSPGVPLDIPVLRASRDHNVRMLGEIEVAWHELSGTMIAITGTNGKSTVTSLIGSMLKAWGENAFVGGNFGIPLVDAIGKDYDWQVVELSSFQLETIADFRPRYAMLLNVSEDHLDRYPDMASYLEAKLRIFENQHDDDIAVLNFDDPLVMQAATDIKARKIFFSSMSVLEEGMSLVDDKILWRWQDMELLFPVEQ
jgi:UDP-N-acetylmuramoylalanine--D-glutamate ligase